ncbi:GNAT family N-acetyltransferase [Bradyrhizobium sp. 179]|uniref:GNAT family N-acetyltransferase n=1 Tax=Bradyrhizobium sp. 179 TaxID=2782648 RepID=UPI001FF73AE1|nr:GNAT family N-acetyltransferase [Bradyrhizobium sp. 179]MCK1544822.1 GNAT family N-acetyltransferase [Bradyrhizobium sp. 179]
MDIPALSTDLNFRRLTNSAEDFAFSFEVKRAAMGPHIAERWAWDENYQRMVHRDHFGEKPFFAIQRNETKIGTLSFMQGDAYIQFGEFYILPHEQRRGLGTIILRHCLGLADKAGLPVRLEYLKWNPVGSLYKRNGFEIIGETGMHWLMERAASIKVERLVWSHAGHRGDPGPSR